MTEIYDIVVIGAGSAGLTGAGFASKMGARVALVERDRVGGDCTWSGCVPSKTFLKSARVAHHMRTADRFGISPRVPEVDLEEVMAHVHEVVMETYAGETPEALRAEGIDIYLEEACFVGPHTLTVGETTLEARNVLLCTGAHPFIPPIPGLDELEYHTYQTIWDLDTLPEHLLVVGGGPIGCELSQGFRHLGSEVTVVESGSRVLRRDEPEASETLASVFQEEGIEIHFGARADKVWREDGEIHLLAGEDECVGDALLVAVGRRPNVEGMNLETAGVVYSSRGIEVNDRLQTSQPHIYAAGDCIGSYQFTHYAGWQAAISVRNALLPGSSKGRREWVPWTTFTQPEVAHAGLTEEQARAKFGDNVSTTVHPMTEVDRARAEVDTEGFVKLVHKGNSKVVGVTILAERAGELIQEWMMVLEGKAGVRDVSTIIHVYPSYAWANVKAAGALLQKQLFEGWLSGPVRTASRLALKFMRWRRGF